jgi:hypothetical protein
MKGKDLYRLRMLTGNSRTGTHLTQVEAARLLGVTPNSYARYERDERRISKSIAKLAKLVLRGIVDPDRPDV